ncbi:MAG: hypothetical protein ACI9O0_000719 [Paracoccaceae bacterium]|jgi:hypothetical protein
MFGLMFGSMTQEILALAIVAGMPVLFIRKIRS